MKPLFPASANAVYWLTIGAIGLALVALPASMMVWIRTPYATGKEDPRTQPIKFDHRHHVRDVGVDCLYCHGFARTGPYAGVPATSVCMGCHNQIWTENPELARVRKSYFENTPIHWQRVNALPDFVFFNHAVHVNKGVGCVTCHGRVDEMAQVYATESLSMGFCLDCHRAPEMHLRPLSAVTDMTWSPRGSQRELGSQLRRELGVRSIVRCSGCHR